MFREELMVPLLFLIAGITTVVLEEKEQKRKMRLSITRASGVDFYLENVIADILKIFWMPYSAILSFQLLGTGVFTTMLAFFSLVFILYWSVTKTVEVVLRFWFHYTIYKGWDIRAFEEALKQFRRFFRWDNERFVTTMNMLSTSVPAIIMLHGVLM